MNNLDDAILQEIFDPLHLQVKPDDNIEDESEQELTESRIKEVEGVKLAETGQIDDAIQCFTEAIALSPESASCHNNMAQALRIKGTTNEAVNFLDKAIELSEGKGKSACQAFVQRAMIHRLNKEEDKAKDDFGKAASLGSGFAQHQLAQMNPYAAMCNKMLSQVINKLQRGDPEDMPSAERPASNYK